MRIGNTTLKTTVWVFNAALFTGTAREREITLEKFRTQDHMLPRNPSLRTKESGIIDDEYIKEALEEIEKDIKNQKIDHPVPHVIKAI